MASVAVTKNDAGDYFAGFVVDGTFVPFANVSAGRVAQLQERAAGLKELAAEEGESAASRHAEAANALPYQPPKTSKAKADEESKGGEN